MLACGLVAFTVVLRYYASLWLGGIYCCIKVYFVDLIIGMAPGLSRRPGLSFLSLQHYSEYRPVESIGEREKLVR